MFSAILTFTNLFLASLLVGSLFCAWFVLNPSRQTAQSYLTVQQQGIRRLDPVMPPLGAATILTTIASAVLGQGDQLRLWLLLATAACFVVAGLITRLRNQPINVIVMTWTSDSIPAHWTSLRDEWWRWHLTRFIAGIAGLSLLIVSTLLRHRL